MNKNITITNETVVSNINTSITINYLKTKKENQYFERKRFGEKEIKASKIAEELIGMLNADGGVLAFGVCDNGEIQDLSSLIEEDKLNTYRSLIIDYITPACNIQLEEVNINDKLIFLYHVEQDIERIFFRKDNKQVFLRVLDTNRKLELDGIKKLEYDKNIRRFEEEVVKNFDFEDLDLNLLKEYKQKINYNGDELDLLCKRYLAKKQDNDYKIYNSAVLLFAQDPEKYIPSASVRYIRYQGMEALTGTQHNVIKDVRFEDNIPNLILKIKKFLNVSFKDYHFLDLNDGKFKKVPEYPQDAWLEGVVNALCHRSYNVQGSSIYIKHFDDKIEISNSGPLPAQVSIENIKTERFARNPRISRVLEDMGYVRQLNEGVSRIYESMEKSMLSEPEYKEINGNVFLTLKNKIRGHSQTIKDDVMRRIENNFHLYNETQGKILQYLFLHNQATIDELCESLNLTKSTIREYLNTFIAEKILERKTEKKRDRNAKYVFNNT
ncbi:ATP-binding protein [Pasteurella atlantica]|uniref:ATP-binding protein n=2 Tax=Pasteurellaceae TaxID=712 RepID=A0ACC6HJ38_9PAST|nr:ATP-binding protein [Pasteurella atlantica]MDP8050880.1 ATP-binding protein [Pasteurella atlantica]MDP8101700.1 ATP-binding protein [Pasteurella atlantica]MDP8104150.1 ATP-binding protein [Pasteurella atlantica]MDP8147536.1 ATP-binding protein [Pasteurella atlantica]